MTAADEISFSLVAYVSVSGAATSIIFVATKVLSRQSTSFIATKLGLSRQNVLSRRTFVATKQRFCLDKHTFVATKDVVCRGKHVFVATKVCHDKSFIVTNICCDKVCLDQKYFAATK